MSTSSIEWTEATWNPVTGCTRVSAGCDNCYAFTMTRRLAGMGQEKYQGLVNPGKKHFNGVVKTWDDVLTLPLKTKKPTTFFVNSMSDLFHEGVPFSFIDKVFAVMASTPHHTYQILTKRPERMREYFNLQPLYEKLIDLAFAGRAMNLALGELGPLPLPNVWLGTSTEDQKTADERIPHLLKVPAAVRFLSCEPLLGPIDIGPYLLRFPETVEEVKSFEATDNLPKNIHWVIAGGESGPGARPSHPDWFRSLRDQCQAAGVAFFFKQWGKWAPDPDGDRCVAMNGINMNNVEPHGTNGEGTVRISNVGKAAAGRLLDGVEWNEMPKV